MLYLLNTAEEKGGILLHEVVPIIIVYWSAGRFNVISPFNIPNTGVQKKGNPMAISISNCVVGNEFK